MVVIVHYSSLPFPLTSGKGLCKDSALVPNLPSSSKRERERGSKKWFLSVQKFRYSEEMETGILYSRVREMRIQPCPFDQEVVYENNGRFC